jgi:hypothetical protein
MLVDRGPDLVLVAILRLCEQLSEPSDCRQVIDGAAESILQIA